MVWCLQWPLCNYGEFLVAKVGNFICNFVHFHYAINMPGMFAKEGKELEKMQSNYEKQIEDLYAEIGRLTTQLSWLKKKIWPP